MRSELEGGVSVVVVDFLVLLLAFFLPRGSESWILAKYRRNFINWAPSTFVVVIKILNLTIDSSADIG